MHNKLVFKKYIIRLVFYKVILEDDKQQMIRIAICDDEKRFCLELEKYIFVNVNIKMYKKWKIKMYNLGSTIHQLSYHQ